MERISFFHRLENFTVLFFFIDSERHEIASEMGKRKKKDAFKEFRSTEKSAFSTVKTTLKALLRNREEIQPVITNIVFQMNDLMIHSYQFIRLYLLKCFNERQPFPEVNETFVLYCMKTLGKSCNSGRKSNDANLLATLKEFYDTELNSCEIISAKALIEISLPVPTFKNVKGSPNLFFGALSESGFQYSNAKTTASPRSSTCKNSLNGDPDPQHVTEDEFVILASLNLRISAAIT